MIEMRPERPEDRDDVRRINDLAFGQPREGRIIDRLREQCSGILSHVAVVGNRAAGHILFSPVTIDTPSAVIAGMGLGPMAVLPEYQNKGIGSVMVREGLRILREQACPFVAVLGHAGFYPRFGFERASEYGLRCQWEGVPDEAFMVLLLDRAAMQAVSGTVRYREEFNEA
jgi:putative acetyltransferase